MTWCSRIGKSALVVLALAVTLFGGTARAQKPASPAPATPKRPDVVSVATLQTLMPTLDGWTRALPAGDVVLVSDTAAYSFAEGDYTNGAMNVKLTIGDTVGVDDCLMALAALVTVLPPNYAERVPPATAISRFEFNGFQAASKWNSEKLAGEFSVVVSSRFVVKAEGTELDSIETLRAIVGRIDLKKLSELKPGK